nr:potassium channel subfamily K member 16-like isoform X2 [Equus asinus]
MFTVTKNVMPANSQPDDHICLETSLTCLLYFSEKIGRILDFRDPHEVRVLGTDVTITHGFCPEENNSRGYGTIAPRTPMGQLFCVFYALLGIPLTIIFLELVSKAISQPLSGLGKYLQNMGIKEGQVKICMLVFFLVTGLLIFILLPPLIFTHTEGWTYEEGLYFAFISLSTIGFGDYVIDTYPPQKHTRLYPAIIILWYTFGLTWITLMFDLFSKILEKTKKTLTCNTLSQTEETSSTKTSFFWALSEQSERESQTSLVK